MLRPHLRLRQVKILCIQRAQEIRAKPSRASSPSDLSTCCLVSCRRRFLSSLTSVWDKYRSTHGREIQSLPEQAALERLLALLRDRADTKELGYKDPHQLDPKRSFANEMTNLQYTTCLDAAMATFSLHVHARIASLVGQGYYTIGPCGEELLASVACALESEDSMALHYRHVATSIARQLLSNTTTNNNKRSGNDQIDYDQTLQNILLARARGFTVSRNDPVTGGVHCSIGGGPQDYIVTSTLASQCPAAVGRALGYSLASKKEKRRKISFVTVGDGSIHNHHFLSSWNLARHAKHSRVKCPIVFGISDNGLSISYATNNYVSTLFRGPNEDPLVPAFHVNGQDMMDIYSQTKEACDYARQYQTPVTILYQRLVRRFGHAATDRQDAYLSRDQIQTMADTDVLWKAIQQAVEVYCVTTYSEMYDRLQEIHLWAGAAFAQAMEEPKVTLEDMMDRVTAPLIPFPASTKKGISVSSTISTTNDNDKFTDMFSGKPQVMRKHMTRVFHDVMEQDPSIVYLGEDVRHGGYYLVTEGLVNAFPDRVIDFPPDETTLLGAATGFSQIGMTPIVEIPYAKYLDCGADMFYELALMHWLSNAQRPNGMVIRLQGFDRGLFGGNFHTHNMLPHIPPGVDVVCFSNGYDYVQGMRHAIAQAKAGRVVMSVDCTYLLNLRHLYGNAKDRQWERHYPVHQSEVLTFDDVRRYTECARPENEYPKLCVVSYGNGVVTALQARRALSERGILSSENALDIIDCPYLSGVPQGLKDLLPEYRGVVFADICKEGPGSNVFSSMITKLQQDSLLPPVWSLVAAPRTYNPLGSTITFLNRDQVESSILRLFEKVEP